MSHLSKTLDIASNLEAISHTFAALSDALEHGDGLYPQALFYPSTELLQIATEIKEHLKEMEKETEENAIQ